MAKITQTLSAKIDKQTQKAEILFRFIGSSTLILRAKSGIFINPSQWNAKKGELKSATFGREEAETKTKLNNLCNTIINTFVETNIDLVTKEWLNTVIDKFHHPHKYEEKTEQIKLSFFEAFDEFLKVRKLSDVRESNFRVLYRALQRYELYSGVKLELDTVSDKMMVDIQDFIRDEYLLFEKPKYKKALKQVPESRVPKQRGHNTLCATFTKLRTFWKWCVDTKKTTNHPTIEVKQEIYGTPYYISTDERKQIERTNLSRHPKLAIQRDIFVLQCCLGCRIGDYYKLLPQNIVNGAVQYVPRKTKEGNPVTVSVPLNETAKAIIERYKNLDAKRIMPFISEQKYNDAIKLIFRAARINRVVQVRNPLTGESEPKPLYEVASSHLARRTFVGNIYKKVKDPNLVGALSGHKEGSKAFSRYREIDDEMKRELVSYID